MKENTGLVYIFTGDGKGKTSAALGTAWRALGNDWQVGWVSFYKEESWKLSELEFVKRCLKPEADKRLSMRLMGKGFFIKKTTKETLSSIKVARVNTTVVIDDDTVDEHKHSAQLALHEIASMLISNRFQVIVLDEVCNAISDGLLDEQSVIDLLLLRGSCHVILTGRKASQKLISASDLVSRVEKVKHPFDQGDNAIKGLDF